MSASLTHARLRELLDYDPRTGLFRWRITDRYVHKRMIAGCLYKTGYRVIRIDRVPYTAGRLVFFYMTGRWPTHQVDHINCNKDDNRWLNLRQATNQQNAANRPRRKIKKYNLPKGVQITPYSRYYASIKIDNWAINLGVFDTAEDAHNAYVTAAKKYFGEFARAK
jgi:HNH endonuclease